MKKKIFSLAVVILLAGTAAICSAQPGKSIFSNNPSTTNDPNLAIAQPVDMLSTQVLFFKMTFAVLLVIGLGVAAIYISKKFLPKLSNLPGKKIRLVETVHLGSRKAVHLFKIGDQKLLIGSTNESINMLADVTVALNNSCENQTDDNLRI